MSLAVSGLVVLLATITRITTCPATSFKKNNSRTLNNDDDDRSDTDSTRTEPDTTISNKDHYASEKTLDNKNHHNYKPFPWEATTRDIGNYGNKTNNQKKEKHNMVDTDRQLELLATMTFANGGFKSPSCPCCQ